MRERKQKLKENGDVGIKGGDHVKKEQLVSNVPDPATKNQSTSLGQNKETDAVSEGRGGGVISSAVMEGRPSMLRNLGLYLFPGVFTRDG